MRQRIEHPTVIRVQFRIRQVLRAFFRYFEYVALNVANSSAVSSIRGLPFMLNMRIGSGAEGSSSRKGPQRISFTPEFAEVRIIALTGRYLFVLLLHDQPTSGMHRHSDVRGFS